MSTVLAPETEKKVQVSEERVREFDEKFAANLKRMRDERGLKRDWVAKRIGVHYNTLKNWELGKAHPGSKELLELSDIYHCEPIEFFKF